MEHITALRQQLRVPASFDECTKLLMDPSVIEAARSFIVAQHPPTSQTRPPSPRILLSSILLTYFPPSMDDMEEDEPSPVDDSTASARNLCKALFDTSVPSAAVYKALLHFRIQLAKRRQAEAAELERMRNQAASLIKDGEQMLREAASQEYWNELQQQLEKDVPEFDRVFDLLFEIRNRISVLVPSSQPHRIDDVKQSIDIEFVRESALQVGLDTGAFLQLFDAIWSAIQSLQSPSMDEEWTAWRVSIHNDMESQPRWATVLPPLLNHILVQLDRVEDAVRHFAPLRS